MKLFSFFFPQKLTEVNSPFNGEIEVVEQFGKRSIRVQGLEQSGSIVERIWEKGIKQLNNITIKQYNNVLILGLGGGSVVKVINRHFPSAQVLGIEIDPVMIKLGKKYFGLSEHKNLKIKICDAFNWLEEVCLNDSNHLNRYDLILVDLYVGKKVPARLEKKVFLNGIKKLLSSNGVVIFNRLRGKKENPKFHQFLDKLNRMYHDIKIIKPVANYLVICR